MRRWLALWVLTRVLLAHAGRWDGGLKLGATEEEDSRPESGEQAVRPEHFQRADQSREQETAFARKARAMPEASILAEVARQERRIKRQVQKVLAKATGKSAAEVELEVLDREDDEKIALNLMTDAEYQQWRWRNKKHNALSLVEAQAALQHHFEKSATYNPHTSLAELSQLEETATSEQRRNFWRMQREKLQPFMAARNASTFNGSSLRQGGPTGWATLLPTIAAFACIQIDINLICIHLPFMYVNLGVAGQLIFNTKTNCWAWQLDVFIGISGGITIAPGLRLGIGAALQGTWKIQEMTFKGSKLDPEQYTLPNKCGAQKNPNISPEGKDFCHSGAPFRLVWVGLKGLLARAADRIFPVRRVKNLMKRLFSLFKRRKKEKTFLQVQTERWQAYKDSLKAPQSTTPVGTDAFQIRCVEFSSSVRPESETPIKGVNKLRCGIEVGAFKESSFAHKSSKLKVYDAESLTLGGQFHVSAEAAVQGGNKVTWINTHRPVYNALLDRVSNKDIRVIVSGSNEENRIEGKVTLGEGVFSHLTNALEVKVGCDMNNANCIGATKIVVSRIRRKGKLSVQCVQAQGLKVQGSDPYCVLQVAPSVVLGANPLWRSTYLKADLNPWWGEGSAWGLYYGEGDFPADGKTGVALRVSLFDAEDGVMDGLKSGILDLIERKDERKVRSADKLLGEAEVTWDELLGARGFNREADKAPRALEKQLLFQSQKSGTVSLRLAWAPLPAQDGERDLADRWQEKFQAAKLAWAASGLYTAGEQFMAKLPKYAEQVLERLVDRPETDRDTANGDCAIERPSFWGKPMRCALLDTDGSSGARLSRKVDEADPKQSLYRVDATPPDWVQDDRVMNLAKAQRVSEREDSVKFWKELGISAANLFTRTVEDLQALFNVYFTDEADWDGNCDSVKPSFELPYERVDGKEKGRPAGWRYEVETPYNQHRVDPADLHGRGVRIAQPDAKQDDVEKAFATYNPAADYVFAYGHGYKPDDPGKTAVARLRFFSSDPPTRGILGGYHVYGDTSPTLNSHLWCDLAQVYAKKVHELRKVGQEEKLASLDERIRSRVTGSLLFNQGAAAEDPRADSHPKVLAEVLTAIDINKDGQLQAEELTLRFDAACVDTADCGERPTCERLRLKEAFVAIFPRLTREIIRYKKRLDELVGKVESATMVHGAKEATLQLIDGVKLWLYDLGACHGEAGRAIEVAERALGGDALNVHAAICRSANLKALKAMRLEEGEDAHTVREQMAMDFHQAFALRSELPLGLQHAALAQKGFLLLGAMWEGLTEVREGLARDDGVEDERERQLVEREKLMLDKLQEHAEKRLTQLSAVINPKGAWRLQFPLTDASFTLTLILEAAKPGFCGSDSAMLWFSVAVTGVSHSWDRQDPPLSLCLTGKVKPFNFGITISTCSAVKEPLRSKIMGGVPPSWDWKDRDTALTLNTKLFGWSPGSSVTSIFTSLMSLTEANKIFSTAFMSASAGALASIPSGVGAVLNGLMGGPLIWFAKGLVDGEVLGVSNNLDAGAAGLRQAIKGIFVMLRGNALEHEKEPGSVALADPKNGEEWVDNEDPTRKGGQAFGGVEGDQFEDDMPEEEDEEDFDEDPRHWLPLEECASFCGAHSRWESKSGQLTGKYVPWMLKSLTRLRHDHCVVCRWQDKTCDRFSMQEDKSFWKGYKCCKSRQCKKAPYRPGMDLPACPKDGEEGALTVETSAAPAEGCCNTACGAKGFEGEGKLVTRFSDEFYLKPDECAHCVWEKGRACKVDWSWQGEQDGDTLCCLKSKCGDNITGDAVVREPPVKAARWDPNPGCTQGGPKPPRMINGSDSGRTGGTACGAKAFGPKDAYKFNDPRFLTEDGQPNHCAQCVWVSRKKSCSGQTVVLKDGTTSPIGLSKQHTVSKGLYHLCCAKLKCIPQGVGLLELQHRAQVTVDAGGAVAASDSQELAADTQDLTDDAQEVGFGRPLAPNSLQQGSDEKTTAGGLSLAWVMVMKATKYTRYYRGFVLDSRGEKVGNEIVTKKRYWGFALNVQAMNSISKPETIVVDNFLPFDLNPVVALNLDWDISDEIKLLLNKVLQAKHESRVKLCKQCVAKKEWAYCERKYVDPRYSEVLGEVCVRRDKQAAGDCNNLVGFDDYGEPTSPRFITTEEECNRMNFRHENEGFKREYGPTKAFLITHGNLNERHAPKAPLDQWGNSMDFYEVNKQEPEKKPESEPR